METATKLGQEANEGLYRFDASEFEIRFPFAETTVTHKLRRPQKNVRIGGKLVNEYSEWLRLVTYSSQPFDKHNNTVISDNAIADQWLWDRLVLQVRGYPGMGEEWIEVTPDIARQMRGTHKEHAINLLYEGKAEILDERTQLTFDGGIWVVRLNIGPDGEPAYQIDFTLREWNEAERRKFKHESHKVLTSREVGKEGMSILSSLEGGEKLFDVLFMSCDGATVAGQQFTGQREAFLTAIDPYWKYKVMSWVTRRWNADRQD